MFYLIKTQGNNIKILDSCENEEHKQKIIDKYFAGNWISFVGDDIVVKKSGKYSRLKDNHYSIFQYITENDGWIFYGTNYAVQLYNLHWVSYEKRDILEMLPLVREKTSDYHISPRSDKSYAEALGGPILEQEKSTY